MLRGPDKRLEVKVSERNIAIFRDPTVILVDQLKDIYIDGELDPIETANLVSQDIPQGLQDRSQSDRGRRRRLGRTVL